MINGPTEPTPTLAPGSDRAAILDHDEIAALRAIVEGTARSTGAAFFESLVRHLASAMGVSYAFVAEFAGVATRVRTLAYWGQRADRGRTSSSTWPGTPCEDVVRGGLCHHPRGVQEKFPRDQDLIDLGIESYLGVPLLDGDGQVLGHLAVFDERPMPAEPRRLFIFRIFATRAAVELERLRVEQQLVESERRYRELYEEAPNAYVSIGRGSPAVRASTVAPPSLLGYVGGGAGRLEPVSSYFADTPAGRPRRRAGARGRLRRRRRSPGWSWRCAAATASPLWVSLWMRPLRGADGRIQAVHSIWVDITDRVLAEAERARLQQQNLYLQEELKSVHNFEEIVGRSPALLAVLDKVGRVAPTDATVLIRRRDGHGQGADRPRDPLEQPAGRQAADQGQLRRLAGGPGRERAVRPREGGLHRRHRPAHRPLRAGRRRHPLPRRDRRAAAGDPGQAAPRPAGARVRASRRHRADQGRRPGHRRHQPRPASRPSARRRSAKTSTTGSASSRSSSRRSASASEDIPLLAQYLLEQVRGADRHGGSTASSPATLRRLIGVPVAGQRPRAGERPRARRHPRDRSDPRSRSIPMSSASPAAEPAERAAGAPWKTSSETISSRSSGRRNGSSTGREGRPRSSVFTPTPSAAG